MSVIRFSFDAMEMAAWLAQLEGDAGDGFMEAASERFFDTYITSTAVLDVCLKKHPRMRFLPFATQVEVDEPRYEIAGVDDGSVDAVILPALIDRADNPIRLLRSAMRALRVGGNIILSVPALEFYRTKSDPPLRADDAHARFYTMGSLFYELQAAWGMNAFRVRFAREYDRKSAPDVQPRGVYSIVAVIEKIGFGGWSPDIERLEVRRLNDVETRAAAPQMMSIDARVLMPRLRPSDFQRICVLKADHIGDFAMAIPVFEELRQLFPHAKITCVCGKWNAELAAALGFFDEIVDCDYYKQDERLGGNDSPTKVFALQRLGEALKNKSFDLAIDLRAPLDGRRLLATVAATYRAGIGSVERMPYLDIALPSLEAFSLGLENSPEAATLLCRAELFAARSTAARGPDFIVLQPRPHDGHLIWGPYTRLERGAYKIWVKLSVVGTLTEPLEIEFDIASQLAQLLVTRVRFGEAGLQQAIEFEAHLDLEGVEFRIRLVDNDRPVTLLFTGVELERLTARPSSRYMPKAQLHVREQMSLLLALVRTRLFGPISDTPALRRRLGVTERARTEPAYFALSPFSNSELRDWPLDGFKELARLLLQQSSASIQLYGAHDHGDLLREFASELGEDGNEGRIVACVGLPWPEVYSGLVNAEAVVTNNSGMAHVGGMLGAHVLAIYSASHQALEWGPQGENVRVLQAALPCGRCGYDLLRECKHGHMCMQALTPNAVLQELRRFSPRTFLV